VLEACASSTVGLFEIAAMARSVKSFNRLTIAAATKADRLHDFAAQQEARGISPADG